MRATIASAARDTGGPLARCLTGGAGRVLMYHRFGDGAGPRWLCRRTFEQHLAYLVRHFRVRRLGDVVAALREGRPLERRTVVITVDDGYADFVDYAYPLLARFEVPATVFLVSDFLERRRWLWFDALHHLLQATDETTLDVEVAGVPRRLPLTGDAARHRAWAVVGGWCQRLTAAERTSLLESLQERLQVPLPPTVTAEYRPMTWAEARGLEPDLVEFGSHTCTHPVLSRCDAGELAWELGESRRMLEARLARPVDALAYPHGEPDDYDERAVGEAEAAGYGCAVVGHGGPLRAGASLFRLERLSAASDTGQFRSTVNGVELLANRYRAWRHAATR